MNVKYLYNILVCGRRNIWLMCSSLVAHVSHKLVPINVVKSIYYFMFRFNLKTLFLLLYEWFNFNNFFPGSVRIPMHMSTCLNTTASNANFVSNHTAGPLLNNDHQTSQQISQQQHQIHQPLTRTAVNNGQRWTSKKSVSWQITFAPDIREETIFTSPADMSSKQRRTWI